MPQKIDQIVDIHFSENVLSEKHLPLKGCKKDLVSGGWYAAADFLGFGTESYLVLKVIQVIGLKMLLMKTCTFVPSARPGGCLRAAAPIP